MLTPPINPPPSRPPMPWVILLLILGGLDKASSCNRTPDESDRWVPLSLSPPTSTECCFSHPCWAGFPSSNGMPIRLKRCRRPGNGLSLVAFGILPHALTMLGWCLTADGFSCWHVSACVCVRACLCACARVCVRLSACHFVTEAHQAAKLSFPLSQSRLRSSRIVD